MTLHEVIMIEVLRVLKLHRGNKTRTAATLGLSLRTLQNWINRYDELIEFRPSRVIQ